MYELSNSVWNLSRDICSGAELLCFLNKEASSIRLNGTQLANDAFICKNVIILYFYMNSTLYPKVALHVIKEWPSVYFFLTINLSGREKQAPQR